MAEKGQNELKRPKAYEDFHQAKITKYMGSGCGSVGRVVASVTRDPQFKSWHRHQFTFQLINRKDENKEKESGNGPSLKKIIKHVIFVFQSIDEMLFYTNWLMTVISLHFIATAAAAEDSTHGAVAQFRKLDGFDINLFHKSRIWKYRRDLALHLRPIQNFDVSFVESQLANGY